MSEALIYKVFCNERKRWYSFKTFEKFCSFLNYLDGLHLTYRQVITEPKPKISKGQTSLLDNLIEV